MSLISRYILSAHIGPFLFGAGTVMFVFLLQFLINNIDKLLGKGLGLWVISQVIVYSLAWMVVLAVPLGVLVATLMAFGNLSAANEVTAIKAGHGSLFRMMRPIIIIGSLLGLGLFWFNDKVLPETNHRFSMLMYDIQRKKPTFSIEAGQFSTDIEQYSILSRQMDSTGRLLGVTIYDNSDYQRLKVISADSGRIAFAPDYKNVILRLYQGEAHVLNHSDYGDYRKVQFATHRILMPAAGFMFERTDEALGSRSDREMSIADLRSIALRADTNAFLARQRYDSINAGHLRFLLEGVALDTGKADTVSPNDSFRSRRRLAPGGLNMQLDDPMFGYDEELLGRPLVDGKKATIAAPALSKKSPKASTTTTTEATKDSLSQEELLAAAYKKVESRLNTLFSLLQTDVFRERDQIVQSNKHMVEVYKKYAIPAACLVFVFVGCPLGIITKRGNFGISGAISLGFYVVYWASLIGGEKLADRGIIEPWLGMWFANILLGILGIFLTIRVSNENILGKGR